MDQKKVNDLRRLKFELDNSSQPGEESRDAIISGTDRLGQQFSGNANDFLAPDLAYKDRMRDILPMQLMDQEQSEFAPNRMNAVDPVQVDRFAKIKQLLGQ